MGADAELEKAMPNLIAANKAVESLDKKFIAEMKAMNKPPSGVDVVMDAVMVFHCMNPHRSSWPLVHDVLLSRHACSKYP